MAPPLDPRGAIGHPLRMGGEAGRRFTEPPPRLRAMPELIPGPSRVEAAGTKPIRLPAFPPATVRRDED